MVTKGTEKPKAAKGEKAAEQNEIEFTPNDPNEEFAKLWTMCSIFITPIKG